jgi:Ti-type conjugative transfer relaxase TraA
MAIYHLHVEPICRSRGQSSVAAAAYRAGEKLVDRRTGVTWDYTDKPGVEHSEIVAPPGAPSWVYLREELWNAVEQIEVRSDAQLAREVRMALPVELDKEQQVELLREFVSREFVSKGMIVDFAIHRDNPDNPHAHVMLSLRDIGEDGFGLKNRDWNEVSALNRWRAAWSEVANTHLARAGHAVTIDHRRLEEQGIALIPGRKLGLGIDRRHPDRLPGYLSERVAEQRRIAAENGAKIVDDPTLALTALTKAQATFTHHDVAKFLHTRTDGAEQFQAACLKVTTSKELVTLGIDERGQPRFTTREMLRLEKGLLERAERMAHVNSHEVSSTRQREVLRDGRLSAEQQQAFLHVTGSRDLAVIVGVAGTGKSTLLESARRGWEAEGLSVRGAALSGIAAENLEKASGIRSRTLASWEMSWSGGRDRLTKRDVLVIDEAGMIGTRQLGKALERAEAAGAKIVLLGDPEQLQAIEAGAAFRGVAAQTGVVELKHVRRQEIGWQREATQALATGRTADALDAYERERRIKPEPTREAARESMLTAWEKGGKLPTTESRLMIAFTRDDVHVLNLAARGRLQAAGKLGTGAIIETERGKREVAVGERLYFLRNDRDLKVKNGSLGTVERMRDGVLTVRLDGDQGRRVTIDPGYYPHLDYGYAATIHKSQGTTVDRTYVLATPHLDRHATYVALSRHRHSAAMFYGRDDFRGGPGREREAAENLKSVLSRARPKELAHDYLERQARVTVEAHTALTDVRRHGERTESLEALSARVGYAALKLWRAKQEEREAAYGSVPAVHAANEKARPGLTQGRGSSHDPEETRRQARENWRNYREQNKDKTQVPDTSLGKDRGLGKGMRQDGLDDDHSL